MNVREKFVFIKVNLEFNISIWKLWALWWPFLCMIYYRKHKECSMISLYISALVTFITWKADFLLKFDWFLCLIEKILQKFDIYKITNLILLGLNIIHKKIYI